MLANGWYHAYWEIVLHHTDFAKRRPKSIIEEDSNLGIVDAVLYDPKKIVASTL